jgi:hypothetical protein
MVVGQDRKLGWPESDEGRQRNPNGEKIWEQVVISEKIKFR